MKKTILFRLLLLSLCAVMLLSLCGCGQAANKPDAPQPTDAGTGTAAAGGTPDAYAYKGEYVTVTGLPDNTYIQPSLFTEDGFYAIGQELIGRQEPSENQVEQYEGQFDIYGSVIYHVGSDGRAEKLPKFSPIEPMANPGGVRDFYSYCNLGRLLMNSEGNLVALMTAGAGWYKGPEEAYGTEEQYSDGYFHNEQNAEILVYSPEGELLSRAPVDLDTTNSWLNTTSVAMDSSGNIIAAMEMNLLAVAPNGSIAWSILSDTYINSIVTRADGGVSVMIYGNDGLPALCAVDEEKKELGEPVAIPNAAWSLFPGNEDYDFYFTSGLYLYGFRLGEDEVRILNWMSCDINSTAVDGNALSIAKDGTITGVTYDYSPTSMETQIFRLTRVPADSLPKKEILSIAQLEYYPDYQLSSQIVRFNRSHDNVRIEYKDYTQYNTETDMSAGMTKFMTEVMAGNLPDILPTKQLPYRQLAAKGLLEDLYPYIDASEDLDRSDFFPNVLSALEVDGHLYQIVPSFSVETLMGAASIVGDTPGWTYDEFYEALAKMPEGCTPLDPYVTRDQVLSSLLYADMDSFVNWNTGEVRFESEKFKDLLRFAKQFPAEYNWDEHDQSEDTQELIRQGRQMLTQTYLYGLDAVIWNSANFGGRATYIGWPTSGGVGSIMQSENGFAISRSCANKDLAWEFIHSMLTEKAQGDIYTIPVSRKAFEKKVSALMEVSYRKDAAGNFLLDDNGEKIQLPKASWTDEHGEMHNIYAMTQEQADEILSVVESCTRMANYDTSISDIVNEQVQAYFLDQKSIDEVCRLIQSKANIYVNEQR
ncbi:MAG: extracellular solute-binding protein [Oscillospiraceae bacterium]|nr:extracellular solute-binding protein [Oscillospiraceae bacterium]